MDLPSNLPNVMPEPEPPKEAQPEKPKGPMTEFERIIAVFFEPTKAFSDLGRHPNWPIVWVLLSVVSLGWVFAIQSKIGWDVVAENNIKMSPKQADALEKLPADQRDKQMAIAAKFTGYSMWAMPVWLLLGSVIFAAIYLAVYNFGMGAKLTFGRSLAITIYASLPQLIYFLLAIVFVYILDPESYNVSKPVASNLGALFDATQHKFLSGVMGSFDIFIIWGSILTAIGFEQCSKVKRWTGFAAIFGVVFFFKLVGAAIGAAFS